MTLDQLRIFLAVAEREHMTRAAEALNLTQSATSAAVSALEERHAVKLFDRVGRRIVLTDAGRRFAEEAKAVLARAELAERTLEELAGLVRGQLRIAASQTVANYWLPTRLARFRAIYPGIELITLIGNSDQAAAAVRSLKADLAIIEGPCDDDQLEATECDGDRMVMIEPRESSCVATAFDAPASANWVLREPGSGTRAVFEEWVASRGLKMSDLRNPLELPSNEAVLSAVEAGAGAAILSELVVTRSIQAGRTSPAEIPLPRRSFQLIRHRERRLSGAEEAFSSVISERHEAAPC